MVKNVEKSGRGGGVLTCFHFKRTMDWYGFCTKLFVLQCFVERNWFYLIGIVCGLAIYNSTVVDLHFPLMLYKKLLDVPPVLDDLKELSPTEGRYATKILQP